MALQDVTFYFMTGLKKSHFRNAVLKGSWDDRGNYSNEWSSTQMESITGDDGCPAFKAVIKLDSAQQNWTFRWGVEIDGPGGNNLWGIITELSEASSDNRYRTFQLNSGNQEERYYYTYCRRLGANKVFTNDHEVPKLQFSVWAPNARKVYVVFGDPQSGYIDDNGNGIDASKNPIKLKKSDKDGIWMSNPVESFDEYFGLPYMYKLETMEGHTVYRTDIFSRSQIGSGNIDPSVPNSNWPRTPETLNGAISCSVIIDPDVVRSEFERPLIGNPTYISTEDFWQDEFTQDRPVPTEINNLVIYELHIGSLGYGKNGPGTIADAISLLDYLVDLGVNAVELLPMADFWGNVGWGYGSTHHLVIQSVAGGRDKYRHFIKACHQRGIAVIQDVVYNHFPNQATRAEYQFDAQQPEKNCFYWYQGHPSDYLIPDGGYIDNGSTERTPNFKEEVVRQLFISSAAFLLEEMHIDGLRVDLTQAIHSDNRLHANGYICDEANSFGRKFLREWSRTLKIIRPTVMLIAEDHTGWDAVTKLPADGGFGFDAAWFVYFYHSLIGDSESSGGNAKLLKQAGFGNNEPLAMDNFATNLFNSQFKKVVYHESHDEAGNSGGSARTMSVAVNNAAIWGDTRFWAERRSRLVFGMSLFSPGTPMFLMGEEIGAHKLYKYDTTLETKEDLVGERAGNGAKLFRFYQDAIKLSRQFHAIRSHNIDILHVHNSNRVIAFKRYMDDEQLIVVASFNNSPFDKYWIHSDSYRIPDGNWKEIFNSDAALYGGLNVGNSGAEIPVKNGNLELRLPASGFVVLVKM